MDVDVEPLAGDLGVRANAAVGLVSTAPEEKAGQAGQATMVNARETIGAVRLEGVLSQLCHQLRNLAGRTNFVKGTELAFPFGVINA